MVRTGWLKIVAAALGVTIGSAGSAGAVDLETFEYGRWTGAASTDDAGAFSRCAVTGRFRRASLTSGRDVAAAITMDRVNGWTLGFVGGAMLNPTKERYVVTVDGEAVLEDRPDAAADQIAVIAVTDTSRFLGALRRGHTLTIAGTNDTFDLTLAGVGRALDWVEDCAKRYATFVPRGREKATADAAELRQDIGQVMQGLLARAEAKEFRVGPPPGIPSFPSEDKSLPWRADGLKGEIQVWAGKSARGLADRIISTSEGCKRRDGTTGGKVAKRDRIVFEVVDCVDAFGSRRIALVLMPRPKGGIYLISVQTKDPAEPEAVDRLGARLADAARKTLLR